MSESNDELRSLVETNFKFLAITMRDIAGRSGQTEAKLLGVQQEFKGIQSRLAVVEGDLAETAHLTRQNREAFEQMADRLDEAVAALGTLAFSAAENRQWRETIERRLDALEGKPTDEAS